MAQVWITAFDRSRSVTDLGCGKTQASVFNRAMAEVIIVVKRRMTDLCRTVIVVVCLQPIVVLAPSGTIEADELSARFLRDAPDAWRKWRDLHSPTEKVVRHVRQGSAGNVYTYSEHYKHNAECTVCMTTSEDKDPMGETRSRREVWGINDRYAFYLKQKTETSPWTIAHLVLLKEGNEAPEIRNQLKRMIWMTNNDLLFIESENLPEMVSKPYFKVLAARLVNEDGVDAVEIDFQYPHPRDETLPYFNNAVRIDSGSIILDPNRYWCMRSFKVSGTYANGVKYTDYQRNEIRDTQPPSLSKSEGQESSTVQSSKQETRIERVEFSRRPPKSDFTLSAFGLPEPIGTVERPTPLYLWVALAGIVLVVSGAAIRRYATRTK